jgi:hypothetical protein
MVQFGPKLKPEEPTIWEGVCLAHGVEPTLWGGVCLAHRAGHLLALSWTWSNALW